MKNTVLSASLVMIILLTANADAESIASMTSGNECRDITFATMQQHVPIPPAAILSKNPVNGICEVILDINGQYVPVYAGKEFVIAGEMFQDRKQITQTRIDGLKAENFIRLRSDIDACVAMSYAPADKAKHTIYMITDPVCPFCHQAESQLKNFADTHDAEFKIILASVHPPVGRRKAVEAVCRNLSLDDYIRGDWQEDNETDDFQCERGIDLIAASEKIVAELGINGVPVFFLENGRRIDGADMTALEKALTDYSVAVSDAK
ncbi:MAG: thioredoxin fold domain-containing protein [Desulfobacterales bacterium]